MSSHAPLSRRLLRLVGRTVGRPLGIAVVLALRLSARRAGIALMYHSVEERTGDPARELVPPHGAAMFAQQVEYVRRYFDVVPARELLDAVRARKRWQKFPLAITFDDDLACHASVALPVLREAGVTATFFVSGASLERPFSFYYERLQRAYDEGVPDLVAVVSGSAEAAGRRADIHELGGLLERMLPDERDAATARLAEAIGPDPEDAGLRADRIRELVAAGMTIGFHTRRHDSLTRLTDEQLARAMTLGRDELAAAAGQPIDTIGYPNGRADGRVADAARAASFRAGFTTRHEPVTPSSDPLLLGRIGPSRRSVGALALEAAVTLFRRESARSTPARERTPS